MTEEIKEYKKEGFFRTIDSYWQKRWESYSLISGKKDKKYILEMFPYPSGKIHMGHVRNYVLGDVLCRYFVKKGYDILHTMAWDAFGLPAENAAKKNNLNPAEWTYNNISSMRKELQSIGLLYNWKDEFATCDLEYYMHQQKIFLDLYNNGLVYKKNVWVNWDPVDKTVLANEQVIDGKGWRSGALVEKKKLSQWMLKITDFADELIEGLDELDWNEEVLQMQRNWIGRSEGFKISFKVNNSSDFKEIEVYTTRPETIFGASCLLLSPDHYISELLSTNNFPLSNFINECQKDNQSRNINLPKKGIFIDFEVINPATGKILPVFIANFVLNDHGTGAIFCCPAHDSRDFEFAKKYDLPVIQVIEPIDGNVDLKNKPYIGDGRLINSESLNGLFIDEAREKFKNREFVNQIAPDGKIQVHFAYKLHDWCISRQRYWGCPIPIINCSKCGLIPAKIPVILPEDIDINSQGNPLNSHPSWKNVICHNCGIVAIRETDTMDTFVDSSWYFIRICSAKNKKIPFSQDDINKWMPVDYYIGGIEHAILHLLYSRFICRALNKCGYNIPKEPFKKLFAQGMICHETYKNKDTGEWVYPSDVYIDVDGKYRVNPESLCGNNILSSEIIVGPSEAMSKSKCNLITPNSIISSYGADTIRWFILSDTPPEKDIEWTNDGVETANRFMQKLLGLVDRKINNFEQFKDNDSSFIKSDISTVSKKFNKFMHQVIDTIGKDIEQLKYNCVIARIYEYYSAINSFEIVNSSDICLCKTALLNLIHLISPIIPHVAEEMWTKMGQTDLVSFSNWPEASHDFLIEDKINIVVQVNSKFRDTVFCDKGLSQDIILSLLKDSVKVKNAINGKEIQSIIYVQDKVINIIAN